MAESGGDDKFVHMELIESWKQNNICFFCRKTNNDAKLKCEKCLEFEYCSIECLENDRAAHKEQCRVISVQKGLHFDKPVTSSGQNFGQGWWKSGTEKKSLPSSRVTFKTIKISDKDYASMTSAYFYPDTDEETSDEVNGAQQTRSNNIKINANKTQDKGSRKNKKSQDHAGETSATKPKSPKSNNVKTKMGNFNSQDVDGQGLNQTDSDPGVSNCSFCGKMGNALKTCTGCRKSKYCDKLC